MLPQRTESVLDVPKSLPLRFCQNWVNESSVRSATFDGGHNWGGDEIYVGREDTAHTDLMGEQWGGDTVQH